MKVMKRAANAAAVFAFANLYGFWCVIYRGENQGRTVEVDGSLAGVLFAVCFLVLAAAYIRLLAKPFLVLKDVRSDRIRHCQRGCENLYAFLVSVTASVLVFLLEVFGVADTAGWMTHNWVIDIVWIVIAEAVVFWTGITRLYLSSVQLGIKWRTIGVICGWIPIVHLIVLTKLIRLASREAAFENQKLIADSDRQEKRICATKYPILMVHGVFFRDFRYLNYWGRIPTALVANGATIYYGNHQSAAAVTDSGQELADRIRQIVQETGCEKVNIIAHSKGGLDSRYAISKLGMDRYVASLTTINTPHRGCEFADYLLEKIPADKQQMIAKTYNSALKKLGDTNPDFIAAVTDLTAAACTKRNEELHDPEGVYIQSTGSCMKKPSGGRFPLNMTNEFVKRFDGENDGLVGSESFEWGQRYTYLRPEGDRGISHGDVIDLNRENLDTFDVREFYVKLVSELREMGF